MELFTSACDFCGVNIDFEVIKDSAGFVHLEALDPKSGSDHLAIWCSKCGPRHRP